MFGTGISSVGDILDLASNVDVIAKSGAWFSYNGDKIGQGRENAKQYLLDHPEILAEVERQVRVKYGLIPDEADKQEEDKAPGKAAEVKEPAEAKAAKK